MTERILTRDALLNRHSAVQLLNMLGYKISYSGLAVADHRGDGPIQTRFGKELYYRAEHVIDWLEQRLNCTVKTAVERGRLRLPVDPAFVLWEDDVPVMTAQFADEAA